MVEALVALILSPAYNLYFPIVKNGPVRPLESILKQFDGDNLILGIQEYSYYVKAAIPPAGSFVLEIQGGHPAHLALLGPVNRLLRQAKVLPPSAPNLHKDQTAFMLCNNIEFTQRGAKISFLDPIRLTPEIMGGSILRQFAPS